MISHNLNYEGGSARSPWTPAKWFPNRKIAKWPPNQQMWVDLNFLIDFCHFVAWKIKNHQIKLFTMHSTLVCTSFVDKHYQHMIHQQRDFRLLNFPLRWLTSNKLFLWRKHDLILILNNSKIVYNYFFKKFKILHNHHSPELILPTKHLLQRSGC